MTAAAKKKPRSCRFKNEARCMVLGCAKHANFAAPPPPRVLKPKGLTRGYENCPACGKVIMPGRRKVRHDETPECLVIRTHAHYKARGWIPLSAALGAVLREAGCPVEFAPGGTHLEPRLVPLPPKPRDEVPEQAAVRPKHGVVHDEVAHELPFAPASVVRLVHAFARMPRDFRLRAVRVLWKREEIGDAIDAIARLGGRVTGFVHRMVVQAEEDAARGLEEGPASPPLADDRG